MHGLCRAAGPLLLRKYLFAKCRENVGIMPEKFKNALHRIS